MNERNATLALLLSRHARDKDGDTSIREMIYVLFCWKKRHTRMEGKLELNSIFFTPMLCRALIANHQTVFIDSQQTLSSSLGYR